MLKLLCFLFLILPLISLSQGSYPLESVLQKGHAKTISCYAFSPDNNYVVTGSKDNSVILWSAESGRQIRVFNRHAEPILSVVFNTEGTKILTSSADNTAKLFDIATGKLLTSVKLQNKDLDLAFFSPDGNKIILYDSRDGVYIYSSETGRFQNEFKRNYGIINTNGVVHSDGQRILSANNYESFFVCGIGQGDTLAEIPFDKAYMVSFSPDGKYIAASSTKLFTQIFDAANYKLLYTLKDGEEECDGCNTKHVFSNTSKYILTMSNKVDAIIWDLSTGKKIRSFNSVRERPYSLKFSSDDSYVLISFDEELFVYETKTGKEKLHLTSDYFSYFDFSFSTDSKMLLAPGVNNEAVLYDATTGKRKKILQGFLNKKRDDGLRFNYAYWTDQRILKYISMKRQIALSPDGKSFVVGNVDSSAMVISTETGKILHQLNGHRQVVFAFDYSPDGKYIATAGGDRAVILWETETGKLVHRFTGHQELIFDVKFNADGTQLSSGSWDGSMRIWDLQNPGDYHRIDLGSVSPYSVGFTNNGLYAVTGDLDRNVDFWEIDAGSSFRTLVGHTGVVSDFAFSQDGKTIATASWDGKVKLWDILTGMLIGKMESHEGAVYSICFDPKSRFVASGSADNTIILWDIEKNSKKILAGHTSSVTSIEISSDGSKLWSCDADGTVKCWNLHTEKELYSRIQISRSEWLATSTDGSFDGSSKSLDVVNYVSGLEVIPVSSLFDKYYTPDLISKIVSGEKQTTSGENLHQLIKNSPVISFDLANLNTRSGAESDTIIDWKQSILPLGVRINSQGETIDEIRIYNNGKLVIQEPMNTDLVFRGGDKDVKRFEVELNDGNNEITAVVVNTDRTESNPINLTIHYDGVAALTDLYILAVGINSYKNPLYNLEYAMNDAQSFVQSLSAHADSLFNSIKVFEIYNEMAVKGNIVAAVEQIKTLVGPEDVFIFYYAGHGVMSYSAVASESDFFIVTHDVTNLYSETSILKQKAISAHELMDYSVDISAAKQLFILDACHSGGALEAFATRGDGREKALAQLARSTGTFFITASQDAQYANEVGDLKHGLFTYALLEVLNGEQGNNGDDKITISELKVYVEERVPELSEKYRGSPQYPTSYGFGQDFPIVILR